MAVTYIQSDHTSIDNPEVNQLVLTLVESQAVSGDLILAATSNGGNVSIDSSLMTFISSSSIGEVTVSLWYGYATSTSPSVTSTCAAGAISHSIMCVVVRGAKQSNPIHFVSENLVTTASSNVTFNNTVSTIAGCIGIHFHQQYRATNGNLSYSSPTDGWTLRIGGNQSTGQYYRTIETKDLPTAGTDSGTSRTQTRVAVQYNVSVVIAPLDASTINTLFFGVNI